MKSFVVWGANTEQLTSNCQNSLVNVIDAPPSNQQSSYYDIDLPAGTTLIYRTSSTDTQPVVTGAMIPEGATVSSLGVVYGPGRLSLYNGKVLNGQLAYPQTIQDAPIKGAIDNDVQTGLLREAVLSESVVIQGIEYAGDTRILFHDSKAGAVLSGTLARTQTLEGIQIPAGMTVSFDEQGIITTIFDENFAPMEGFQSKSPGFN